MSSPTSDLSKIGFVKTFLLPSLSIFLIPVIGLAFFYHAQYLFDLRTRDAIVQQIKSDQSITPEERERAIDQFTRVPFSRMLLDEDFASEIDSVLRTRYATFRWMIRLSLISIGLGILVFVLAGICVALSTRSQLAQYYSLSLGWQILRIYGAVQTIIAGILLVALSYWVTALWLNVFSAKLILVAGLIAVVGAFAVLYSIFRRIKNDFEINGVVLDREESAPIWRKMEEICGRVGTKVPDQIIAGIDDNFFVTEMPILVHGKKMKGKSLFISLPLLKQLNSGEADAVLAHEMAHFSGQDTMYTKRIAPLLTRYNVYLVALHENFVALPVFYFMNCFRVLFELSLGKISREREFRADRVAADTTSPRDFSGALLRIGAYSKFRHSVEMELFRTERKLDAADIADRIVHGFPEYAVKFSQTPEIGGAETAHPFDSHPPTSQRLSALGIDLNPESAAGFLAGQGDGGWHSMIPNSEAVERQMWQAYEEQFRTNHEESLPYRFLPETDEERAIVEAVFPPRNWENKGLSITLDCATMMFSEWPDPIAHREVVKWEFTDKQVLSLICQTASRTRKIALRKFKKADQQSIFIEYQRYYARCVGAVEYQNHVAAEKAAKDSTPQDHSASSDTSPQSEANA